MSPGAPATGGTSENTVQVPSSSTFSFKAPFPASTPSTPFSALKQRRVSLALPSSPRLVQAWNFRDDTGLDSHVPETEGSGLVPEKRGKMRKIAPVVDDESFQEKRQRKKWTDEETHMLVMGCNRHGVGNWKTILSDPNLKFDNRSPVDLKDRFRTHFPDAYKEHYPNARTHLSNKVRSTLPDGSSLFEKTRSKKRRPFTEEEDKALKAGYEKHGTVWATIVKDPVFREQGRRSTDLRDRFRNAFPELYQAAGYKPRNASKKKLLMDGAPLPVRAATDDQLAMSTTGPVRSRRRAHTSQGLFRGGTKSVPQSTACSEDEDSSAGEEDGPIFKTPRTPVLVDNVSTSSSRLKESMSFENNGINMAPLDHSDPAVISDFSNNNHYLSNEMDGQSQTWSSGVNTPTHSNHAWSTAAASPTSSHLSADYLMNAHSPSHHRRDLLNNIEMIGKSAWGTHDWFSANPRLDSGNSSNISYPSRGDDALSPASPFSFHNLNHGVLDRYDLHPTLFPHDFSSEVGVGDSHSTFSDEMFPPPSGFRGFTHHSNYAGDLIFGARTHQPQHPQNYYGSGFGFGTAGLGLSGMSQTTGIHPVQMSLPGIDEIELTGITLDDNANNNNSGGVMMDESGIEIDQQQKDEPHEPSLMGSDRFSLDDLVDLSSHELEQHATPPGTPLISPSRSARRSSESTFQHYHGTHGRSISVPPSEARSSGAMTSPSPPTSTPASRPMQFHSSSQPDMSTSRNGHFFGHEQGGQQQQSLISDNAYEKTPLLPPQHQPAPPTSAPLYPSILMPSASQDAYTWRSVTPGDISSNLSANLNLSFLDLHYFGHVPVGAVNGTGSGTNSVNGHAHGHSVTNNGDHDISDAQNIRQGQALDLAQSIASSSATLMNSSLKSLGIPLGHIPQFVHPQGGAGLGLHERLVPATVRGKGHGGARSHSTHHRGQSVVCPQDLVLRNDNKRKRASWDGAHV